MECTEIREIVSACVDGEAEPEEVRLVQAHLEGCAGCRALEARMRAVGEAVARTEGTVPPGFRETLFSRMEAEDLLPKRRSIFAFSVRWAAIPVAAAAALALFLLTSREAGHDLVARQGGQQVARTVERTDPGSSASGKTAVPGERPAVSPPAAPARSLAMELSEEEKEIVAYLEVLEDPAAFDETEEEDVIDIFLSPGRRKG